MAARISHSGMQIDSQLFEFINLEVLPGTGISSESFWPKFAAVVDELTPINRVLLTKRDDFQLQIDLYHQSHLEFDLQQYRTFLTQIGYLAPEVGDFSITTAQLSLKLPCMVRRNLLCL